MPATAILELKSGVFVDVLNPDVSEVTIDMIAHALAHQPRFAGHTHRHYSVAEHSLLVSYIVPAENALDGLMHDATEALLCDIPTPIKKHLPQYYEIEKGLHDALADHFGFNPTIPAPVKEVDARICISEKLHFIGPEGLDGPGWVGLTSVFKPYEGFGPLVRSFEYDTRNDMETIKKMFVERYWYLVGQEAT